MQMHLLMPLIALNVIRENMEIPQARPLACSARKAKLQERGGLIPRALHARGQGDILTMYKMNAIFVMPDFIQSTMCMEIGNV